MVASKDNFFCNQHSLMILGVIAMFSYVRILNNIFLGILTSIIETLFSIRFILVQPDHFVDLFILDVHMEKDVPFFMYDLHVQLQVPR